MTSTECSMYHLKDKMAERHGIHKDVYTLQDELRHIIYQGKCIPNSQPSRNSVKYTMVYEGKLMTVVYLTDKNIVVTTY
jgi:hypothetical protein